MITRRRRTDGTTGRPRSWIFPALVAGLAGQASLFGLRPILSYRAIDLGAGVVEIGILAASFAILPVFFAVPLGRHIDVRGGRMIGIAGASTSLASTILFIFANDVIQLVVINLALGLGQLALAISLQSFIGNRTLGGGRDRAFAQFSLATSLGHIGGPLLATYSGVAAAPFMGSLHIGAFLFCAGCQLAALVAALTFPKNPPLVVKTKPKPVPLKEVLVVPHMTTAVFSSIVTLSVLDLLTAYLPLWATESGVSEITVGWLLAVRGAASVVSRLLLTSALRWRPHIVVAAYSTLLAGVSFACLAFADLTIAYASMVLLGVSLGLMQPLTMAWISNLTPSGTIAVALSIRMSGNRAGQVLIPLAASSFSTVSSQPTGMVFLLCAALLTTSSGISAFTSRRNRA